MASPDVTSKIRQLDNDVQSIYEMLAKIEATQTRQGNRLGELADSVAEVDGKLGEVDGKLTEMDGNLGEMGRKLDDMDGKLDSIVALLQRR